MIKFGIQQGLNVARLGFNEDQQLLALMIADRFGYDSGWAMDHTNVPQWPKAIVNDAWIFLSAATQVTKRLELGTCVTDAIRRHPSTVALQTITMDRLSHGRAILGIGAGEAQNIKEFGIQWDKPVSRLEEQLQVIRLLFNSSPDNRVSFEGKFYKLDNACLQASSIRKPMPPIYVAAGAPRTLSITARYGDGWLPIAYTPELYEYHASIIREEAKKAGRDLDNFSFALDIDVYFTDDPEEAWLKLRSAVKVGLYKPELLKVYNIQQRSDFDFRKYFTEYSMTNPELMRKMREAAQDIPDTIARSSIGIGGPEDIIPVFERFIKAGVNHFIIRFWGEGYYKSIEQFGRKVIPYFRDNYKD
ncbi:MAG: LLM class flavin-dependent oxidoreductase [Candidatus Nitrosocaldaceae archaeon]|nr:MAG: LLM class flavin-dependent oxidoreductase [Candidatus Nitrosocaldaceae archaeon]